MPDDNSPSAILSKQTFELRISSHKTDMPTVSIPAGNSRSGSFNLSPAQFLKSFRNSQFFRHTH